MTESEKHTPRAACIAAMMFAAQALMLLEAQAQEQPAVEAGSSAPAEAASQCKAPKLDPASRSKFVAGTRQANISGTISTDPLRKASPLAERGYTRVGVLVKEHPVGAFSRAALTIFGNEFHHATSEELGTAGALASLFSSRGDGSEGVTVIDMTPHAAEIWATLEWHNWSSTWRFDPKKPDKLSYAHGLRDRFGIQALLIIQEEQGLDFLHRTNVQRGSKGLFERFGAMHAIAAFKTQLLDLESGLMPKPGYYTQGSAKYLPGLVWRGAWACYPPDEQSAIRAALREVYENNVDRTLAMYKIRGVVPETDDWATEASVD